ncbi:MAG TPA: aspartate kinase [Candidatus Dormibacteraeota bacterium]|nr:aspartate kinase [Candidatus Dormibacteraeota bacterium]
MTHERRAVLKFGGTSVATRDQRELAFARIRDARADGFATVAVVSAMGRAPSPYATDTLLEAIDGRSGSANADMLLACGELLSAAIFADELTAAGVPARALSGANAGIVTDAHYGDATILRVDAERIERMLDEGIVPVVAGFQGATEDGMLTTLGRGGTDLSAIAIGNAIDAERVDIYTDVSGAMTADPRRIERARTIERASLEEMTELAEHGAKVMHHKAADYAQRTQTPYTIKGLATDRGTLVVDGVDHHRPVTGVTSSGRLTWVRIIRGDIENPQQRMQTELEMFRRMADAGISIDQVSINQAGVSFVVQGDSANAVRTLLGDLNLAVRVREGCSKISVVGSGMRGTPGVVLQVVTALSNADVEIIHCTDSNITISILVPEADVQRAEAAVHEHFALNAEEART